MAAYKTITESFVKRITKKLVKFKLQYGSEVRRWPKLTTTSVNRPGNYYAFVALKRTRKWINMESMGLRSAGNNMNAYLHVLEIYSKALLAGKDHGYKIKYVWDPVDHDPVAEVRDCPYTGIRQRHHDIVLDDSGCFALSGEGIIQEVKDNVAKSLTKSLLDEGIDDIYIPRGVEPMTKHKLLQAQIRMVENERARIIDQCVSEKNYLNTNATITLDQINELLIKMRAKEEADYGSTGIQR